MRLSDADRELLYEKLARHHAVGRLTVEELERRVSALAACETEEQAREILTDLPSLPPPPPARTPSTRGRGHGEAEAAGPGWRPTPERFRDPRTARVMRVWVDEAGNRRYVPENA
ncbi:MAG TPA: DUF1707 domain-containing protein [Solirubrobacteraceae bacterium]